MNEKEQVLSVLDDLGIAYEVIEHPPVHTMEDMDALGIFTKGEACKNLFLRNANGKIHYVVSMLKDKHPDIQTTLRSQLGSSRLSFGSDERLQKHLGLLPGAVSPFGILNDPAHDVVVALDREILSREYVGFHPNVNTAFVWLRPADLVRFIEAEGNDLVWLDC